MKPTPEQVEAAKACVRCEDTHAQSLILAAAGDYDISSNAALILLAALEAAEAKVEAMASRESASISKEIETSADMLAQVQNAEARVKELEQQLRGTMQAGGYDYFSRRLQECERYWGIARNYAEQMKKKLEAAEQDSARLAEALQTIASYDRDSHHGEGLCPYGCDTPAIARDALAARKAQP